MNTIQSAKEKLLVLRQSALITNPAARVPICLVLDASGSMDTVISGDYHKTGQKVTKDGATYDIVEGQTVTRLDELNSGLDQFLRELLEDPQARLSAEVCVVAFADKAQEIFDFAPLTIEHLGTKIASCGGQTSIGSGVKLALELLDRRKAEYQNAAVDYFQPWLVVITDGQPTDQTHLEAAADIRMRVQARKLSVFAIAVGGVTDVSELAKISPARPPLRLKGTKFREFFEWLSKSVERVSGSIPGESVKLDTKGIDSWGEL